MDRKKQIGLVAGLVLPAMLVAVSPFEGLGLSGTLVAAVLLGAVVWWIAEVLPDYVTAIAMSVAFIVFADVPTSVVFSAFASSTWWLLLAAFCLGLGMQRSGLLRRLSLVLTRRFSRTFRGQATGLMLAGIAAGPFIPSLAAKCAILTPIALDVSDQMGYERKSKQANGLFLAAFTAVRNVAPAVLSASVLGYVTLGLLPEEMRDQFDMLHWLVLALPWLLVVMMLNYVALLVLYEPREERRARVRFGRRAEESHEPSERARAFSAEAARGAGAEAASDDLGPMTKAEKQMLAIMGVTVALWALERWHGIPAHVVALAAVVVMALAGRFERADIRQGIAWDTIIFVGAALSLTPVFSHVGLDEWLVGKCAPLLAGFAGNPYAIVAGVAALTLLLRFVIVSEAAFINIFMAFAVPLAPQLGVSPWVIGFCVYAMVNPWFVKYQNAVYLAAVGSVGGSMTEHADLARYCAVYVLICFVGLMVSVPYWQWAGLV